MKQEYYIFGLVGIGAVIVIYFLIQEQNATAAAAAGDGSAAPPPGVGQQSYPNVQPIQLGNVTIGATPPEQSYNMGQQFPGVQVGTAQSECGCDDDDCDQAGIPVTTQTIPQSVLAFAGSNLASFQAKVAGTTTSGVEAARTAMVPTGGGRAGGSVGNGAGGAIGAPAADSAPVTFG
jgi:hypothetical protein